MELLRYATLLRRWAWLLLLGTLIAGATAFLVSREMTPVYEASTTLLINQASSSSATTDYNSILGSERLARTYAQLMLKRPVLAEVIGNLQLAEAPEQLAKRVKVTPVRDTQLIVVTVEDPGPAQAAAIANQIVAVFAAQNSATQAERFAESKHSLEQELAKLQSDIDAAQAALDGLKSDASSAERGRLQDVLAQYRTSYATVLKSLEEVRLAEAQQTNGVSVAEEAVPPQIPVRPRTIVNTALAAMVGLLLMIGLALLLEYLNDRVASLDEAAALLQTGALAAVGRIEGQTPADKLVTLKDPYAHTTEAYQMLRVRLEVARFEQPLHTLLITSSNQGEGKSTTAANLAVAMARAGKQVILVDTDLRRPALHRLFHHHNGRGVTTALLREPGTSLLEHMQVTKLDNLLLLPSGPLPSDPAAMLSSPRMTTLVAELKDMADVVIFDSPPLLAVADATLLAHISDATLLVALAGSTRSGALRRAGELLAQAGITLAGVVLNRAAKESGGYGYYYYYGDERRQQHGWWKTIFARGKEHSDHAGSGDAISADTAAAMALARAQARERLKAQMARLGRRRSRTDIDDPALNDEVAAMTASQDQEPPRRNGKGPH